MATNAGRPFGKAVSTFPHGGNPYHDNKGLFASGPNAAAQPGVRATPVFVPAIIAGAMTAEELAAAGEAAITALGTYYAQRHSEQCKAEWEAAKEYCGRLDRQGKLGSDGYRGMGKTFDECVRGQVSEACGGNPTQ